MHAAINRSGGAIGAAMIHLSSIPPGTGSVDGRQACGPAPLSSQPSAVLPPANADTGCVDGIAVPPRRRHATYKISRERVEFAARLLVHRVSKGRIKQILREKFEIKFRQAERVISRAREWLIEQSDRSREEEVALLMGVFDEVLRSPEASVRDRLDAARSIRELKGLDANRKIASTGDASAAAGLAQVNIQMLSLTDAQKESLLAASLALRGIAGPIVESHAIPLDAASSDGS
jgi:hypothetical protein